MTTEEEYDGCANRETWAFMLHLNNDQSLQRWAHGVVRDRIEQGSTITRGVHVGRVGDALIEAFLEADDDSDLIRMMRREVGSTWRVNHLEVGRSFAEDVLEGSEEYRIEDSEIIRIDEDGETKA